jgi:hypothetical protein
MIALGKFFESYKGRWVHAGQRVEVYRNLKFKDKIVYSIRDKRTGLVLGHASDLLLTNQCKFVVHEVGRQRVLREKKKNVHAWIEGSYGIIHAGDDRIFSDGTPVYYNPYTNSHFEMVDCGEPVVGANLVYIQEDLVAASAVIRLWDIRR